VDKQVEYIIETYKSKLINDLETEDFAFAFFPNSEEVVDKIEPITRSNSFGNSTITFFQDFGDNNKPSLTDYNICYVDGFKFIKLITPFLLERSYDFIITKREEFNKIIKILKDRVSNKSLNDKLKNPIIGIDFDFFRKETIDFLLNDEFRSYCSKKFIRLKRGIILEGPPGTGKSNILTWIKIQAKNNGIEFYSFDNPKDFLDNRQRYFENKKAIFAFEDFDAFLKERNDTDNSPNTILSSILNTLDGIDEIEDVVSIFTTNRINTFDSAFIRPGRIDKVIRFDPPSDVNIFKFFEAYIPEYSQKELSILFEYLKEHCKLISYAVLKGICDDINIAMFNNEEKKISIENILDIAKEKTKGANKNTEEKSLKSFVL